LPEDHTDQSIVKGTREGAQRYCVVACHVLWRELCHYAVQSRNVFDFRFLEQGLHNTPDLLRAELQKAVDSADGECDAVLVGYGLCSNGLVGIRANGTPLVVMRAHDCITFLLGSKERYREYFDSHPGTYWFSPGWIDDCIMPGQRRHEIVRRQYVETYGEDNADYLMQMEQAWMNNYSNAAYVDLAVGDTARDHALTRESAEWLGWQADFLEGNPRLMIDFLEGNWNDEDFLVVNPGERVVASHDERIIAVESCR